MPWSGISHPSAPLLDPPTSPSGWLPCSPSLQAPETPSTPPCPFKRKGREGAGTSEGCLRGTPPRDATGWAPRGGRQAGWGKSRGQESGFSGNEIALRNNESRFFNSLHEHAFNCSHCFGSRGNLTSEKAEMKWVWVGILCHFMDLESQAKHSSETPFQWDHSSLPQRGRWGCIRGPGTGLSRVHCGQKRPRSPRAPIDPHWGRGEQRFEIILHAVQTLSPAPSGEVLTKLQILRPLLQPIKPNFVGMEFVGGGYKLSM